MNKFSMSLIALVAGIAIAGSAYARPTIYPSGVTIYDPEKAYNGYTLISGSYADIYSYADAKGKGVFTTEQAHDYMNEPLNAYSTYTSDKVQLVDMNGNVVNEWKAPGTNKKAYLLENGNLLAMNQAEKAVVEYNWEGEEVWRYETRLGPHHDMKRLENGNTLILCYGDINAKARARIADPIRRTQEIQGDVLLEVTPEKKIVWSWDASDHLDINNYHILEPVKDWSHGNTVKTLPENKWYDAGDQRFKPGNVLFNARNMNQFFIISKETGEVVWESPRDFQTPVAGLSLGHEPYMIPKGLPGEGNFMMFDNGNGDRLPGMRHNGHSIVWEFQPDTFEVVWRYMAMPGYSDRFLSRVQGTAYKLPNGNVLISEDVSGRTFQVKPDHEHPDGGEIVWEHIGLETVNRTQMYSYDYIEQFASLSKSEKKVSPLDPKFFHVLPDEDRTAEVQTTFKPE